MSRRQLSRKIASGAHETRRFKTAKNDHVLTFVTFLIIVTLYVALLLWCFWPLVRKPLTFRPRYLLGVLMLAATVVPLLTLPLELVFLKYFENMRGYAIAVALFPRTLPAFVDNILDWKTATATLIEITYPIEIAGVHYSPVQRIACTTRKMYAIDKGIDVQFFKDYPTASGGQLVARAGDAIVAVDHSNLCQYLKAGRVQIGALPDHSNAHYIFQQIYLLRGEADKIQLYRLLHYNDELAIDDIVLHAPEIVRIEQKPAKEIIAPEALWPMERRGEMGSERPPIVDKLESEMRSCIIYIQTSPDSTSGFPRISRYTSGGAADPESCRRFMKRGLAQASPAQ
jgi:hypothetical protein